MPNENMAQSSAQTEVNPASAVQPQGDAKKRGNVTVNQATAHFLQSMQAEVRKFEEAGKTAGDKATPTPAKVEAEIKPPAAEATQPKPETETKVEDKPKEETPEVSSETDESESHDALSQRLSQFSAEQQEAIKTILAEQKARIQEKIDKRIGKEVAKRGELERQLQSIQQAKPTAAPFDPPAPTATTIPASVPTELPLSQINDITALQREYQQAKEAQRLVDDALATGASEDGMYRIAGKDYSKEDVINIRRTTRSLLEDQIPQRHAFLSQRQQAVQTAVQEFPWMKDSSTIEYQQAAKMIAENPWLRNLPNMELVIGVQIEGLKTIEARKKVATESKKEVRRSAPPSDQTALGGGTISGSRATGDTIARRALEGERETLSKSRGMRTRDVAAFLERQEKLKTQSR